MVCVLNLSLMILPGSQRGLPQLCVIEVDAGGVCLVCIAEGGFLKQQGMVCLDVEIQKKNMMRGSAGDTTEVIALSLDAVSRFVVCVQVCQSFPQFWPSAAWCFAGGQALNVLVGTAVPLAIAYALDRRARALFMKDCV